MNEKVITTSHRNAFQPTIILNADTRNTDFPEEAMEEVKDLWAEKELGNDTSYWYFDRENDVEYDDEFNEIPVEEVYPNLCAYLKKYGLTKVLIHFSW